MNKNGRKSLIEEQTRVKTIRLAFAKYLQFLRSPQYTLKDKVPYATEILKRSIPNVTEEIGNVSANTIINIVKDYAPKQIEQLNESRQSIRSEVHPETNTGS